MLLYPPVYGAYTEMFTGLSPVVTKHVNRSYIIPWGRVAELKPELEEATRSETQGGTGAAKKLYDWCATEVAAYT
jgi:retinol dehydrogenase-12